MAFKKKIKLELSEFNFVTLPIKPLVSCNAKEIAFFIE